MAIDSERDRKSAAWVGQTFSPPTIVPDGSLEREDRQTISWGYYGISAGEGESSFQAAWAVAANHLLVGGLS